MYPEIMVTPEQIKQWIEAGLEAAQVEIEGDGHHFNAVIGWCMAPWEIK
jgi:acid stress-induced BolA-like protein IbaG/YrbA